MARIGGPLRVRQPVSADPCGSGAALGKIHVQRPVHRPRAVHGRSRHPGHQHVVGALVPLLPDDPVQGDEEHENEAVMAIVSRIDRDPDREHRDDEAEIGRAQIAMAAERQRAEQRHRGGDRQRAPGAAIVADDIPVVRRGLAPVGGQDGGRHPHQRCQQAVDRGGGLRDGRDCVGSRPGGRDRQCGRGRKADHRQRRAHAALELQCAADGGERQKVNAHIGHQAEQQPRPGRAARDHEAEQQRHAETIAARHDGIFERKIVAERQQQLFEQAERRSDPDEGDQRHADRGLHHGQEVRVVIHTGADKEDEVPEAGMALVGEIVEQAQGPARRPGDQQRLELVPPGRVGKHPVDRPGAEQGGERRVLAPLRRTREEHGESCGEGSVAGQRDHGETCRHGRPAVGPDAPGRRPDRRRIRSADEPCDPTARHPAACDLKAV